MIACCLQVRGGARPAVRRGIVAAAIERPRVRRDPPADQALVARHQVNAAQRHVRLAGAEVARQVGGVELDAQLRMGVVQILQDRRQDGDGVDFLHGQADRAAGVAGLGARGLGETGGRGLHRLGLRHQRLARRGQRIAGLPPLEEDEAEPLLERGDAPRRRRLADPERAAGAERAAAARDGEEKTEIVPVDLHGGHGLPCARAGARVILHFCRLVVQYRCLRCDLQLI